METVTAGHMVLQGWRKKSTSNSSPVSPIHPTRRKPPASDSSKPAFDRKLERKLPALSLPSTPDPFALLIITFLASLEDIFASSRGLPSLDKPSLPCVLTVIVRLLHLLPSFHIQPLDQGSFPPSSFPVRRTSSSSQPEFLTMAASSAVQNPPAPTDSKSGRKKKAKAAERTESPAPPASPAPEKAEGQEDASESVYVRELQK
jgi:hypothetical protein